MAPAAQVIGADHIVLRVKDPIASCNWYSNHLGLEPLRIEEYKAGKVPFPSVRITSTFLIDFMKAADQPASATSPDPKANVDHFCLVVSGDSIETVRQQLAAVGIKAESQFDGVVVKRFGAQGNAMSIYVRDPDHNIVELRTYAGVSDDPAAPDKPVNENKIENGSGI